MPIFRARYAATRSEIAIARCAIRDFARLHGFGAADLYDVELAVGEALNNAAEHGNKERGHVEVTCSFDAGRLVIEVLDDGGGFAPEKVAKPKHSSDPAVRGFGLYLMRMLMDEVSHSNGGRKVTLTKRRAENVRSEEPRKNGSEHS